MTDSVSTTPSLPTRRIGDLRVSSIGLGCMPLSFPEMLPFRDRAIETIHASLDAGVTLLDTANIYSPSADEVGHNEALVGEALRSWSGDQSSVLLTTKGGITHTAEDGWGRDASIAGLQRAAEASLAKLGVDRIALYQFHRHDSNMTYEAQMKSLVALRDTKLVERIGLSNTTVTELRLGLEILGGPDDGGIVSVQNEYSPRLRADGDVLALCTELGIAYLPWSPLGGSSQASEVGSRYAAFAEVGAELDVSPQQVALAWLLAMSPVMIPIPGSSRPETARDSAAAATLQLSTEQITRLNATEPESTIQYEGELSRSPLR